MTADAKEITTDSNELALPAIERERRTGHPAVTRALFLVPITILAYPVTFDTLRTDLRGAAPIALLSSVPLIALLLGIAYAIGVSDRHAIHDRALDYIVGTPMLGAAAAVVVVLPAEFSTFFWAWRLDLLSMPMFVAGAATLLFGTRTLWRLRVPLTILCLVWLVPFVHLVPGWERALGAAIRGAGTKGHGAATTVISRLASVAGRGQPAPIVGAVAAWFDLAGAAVAGTLDVVVLLGAAGSGSVLRGGARKLAWLVVGVVLGGFVWNVSVGLTSLMGRIWAGVAVELVPARPLVWCGTVGLWVLLAPALGIPIYGPLRKGTEPAKTAWTRPTGGVRGAPRAAPRLWAALAFIALAGCMIGVADLGMQPFRLAEGNTGVPRLREFAAAPVTVDGWKVQREGNVEWARKLFGPGTSWSRYRYVPTTGDDTVPSETIRLDAVTTPSSAELSAYSAQDTYDIQSDQIVSRGTVALASDVFGQDIVYRTRAGREQALVSWELPVETADGVQYERMTLLMGDPGGLTIHGSVPAPGLSELAGIAVVNSINPSTGVAAHPVATRRVDLLTSFGRQLVAAMLHAPPSASSPPSSWVQF